MENGSGSHRGLCAGTSRRGILRAGALAMGGLTLSRLLRAEAPADGDATGLTTSGPASNTAASNTGRPGGATPNKFDITATFSIVAVDPENRVCGAAVASKYPAVGKVVPYVRAEVGAFCTQHHHVPKWGEPIVTTEESSTCKAGRKSTIRQTPPPTAAIGRR
ncbi:MAG: DUF1028 domain-containing protein [Planctomycetia bacterium]|nr:DUF1028 domain-containing protein [Planctomycetia bacterium]